MLSDEDDEVVGWAAYGVGFSCKGHEDAFVKALVARAVTWSSSSQSTIEAGVTAGSRRIDPAFAIARALGHCATLAAEKTLSQWLDARGRFAEAAVFALGDVATRRGALADETITTLLSVAASGSAHASQSPASLAAFSLQPISRLSSVPDAFRERVLDTAKNAFDASGDGRIFGIRAFAKAAAGGGKREPRDEAAAALGRIATAKNYAIAERVEAARGLGLLGPHARKSAAEALERLVPGVREAANGPEFHVIMALLEVLGSDGEDAEKSLYALAALPLPNGAGVDGGASDHDPSALRVRELRCRAAGALARRDYQAEVLVQCAPSGTEARERAELRAILAAGIVGAREGALARLGRSRHVRIREAALEGSATHPECAALHRSLVAEALQSKQAGLVATAADLVRANPAHFTVDQRGGSALAPEVASALVAALSEPFSEDLVETRAALLDAAVATSNPRAKELASKAACDDNVTIRQRGVKALAALRGGAADDASDTKCPTTNPTAAPEIEHPLVGRVRLGFMIGGRSVTVDLDPALAPVTSARLTALARAGFYRGIVVHRVVPGFVVQLGDPGGDGYGGSGKALRCETSPVPFQPLDVGMALAGRDTGSSQFFVTLSRTPHLDGEYAEVGHAGGDWAGIVEGDIIDDVTVVER